MVIEAFVINLRHKIIQFRQSKRLLIISVAVLVFATVGTYGIMSYLHWNDFNNRSASASNSLRTAISASLGTEKAPSSAPDTINTLVREFEEKYGQSPCQSPAVFNWQTVLPAVKELQDNCNQNFSNSLNVIEKLKPLSVFLKDQAEALTEVAEVTEATKNPTDYTAASTSWKSLTESTKLSQSNSFQPIVASIQSSASLISAAFTALATSNNNEDKAAFDAATSNLTTAYASLANVTTATKTEQTKLISQLIEAYDKL